MNGSINTTSSSILTIVLIVVLSLAGCGAIKDLGLGALPVYELPEFNLADKDKAILERWSREAPETFRKVQGAALAYKSILQTHNSWAIARNKERLEAMGFKAEDLKKLTK